MLAFKLRLLKRLDGLMGSHLCRHMPPSAARNGYSKSPWKLQPIPADRMRRILVIRPGGIGDAVLLFPMLAALRDHFAQAAIDVLAERRNADVFRINRLVSSVYSYDHQPLATYRRLRAAGYQLVIDSEQYHCFSALLANRLEPDYICGFDTAGRGRMQTHRVRYCEQVYEALTFLDLAAAVTERQLTFDPEAPFLEVDQRWLDWADKTLGGPAAQATVVIAPTTSAPQRFWPPLRYASVARRLVDRGLRVVLLGGKDARGAADVIAARLPRGAALNLTGQTSLCQAAGIIKRARLYISADTGTLHIAYGAGTPTVHLFGSGIQCKWAPPGSKYRMINKGLPCSPCTRYGYTPPCPYHAACMDAITVDDVLGVIEEVLI